MVAFLSSVVGYVVTAILSALGGWFLKMLHTYIQDRQDEAATAAAQKALQDAKTKQELDDAAKKISDGFGNGGTT